MDDFRRQMADHMVRYKKDVLKVADCGTWRGKEYEHILPEELWELNLWDGIRYKAREYFSRFGIAWHQDRHNLLSSQLFAVNLFFPFTSEPEMLKPSLRPHCQDLASVVGVDFEYIGPRDRNDPSGYRDYFNEGGSRGKNRTSTDVAIEWLNLAGRKNLLLLEFKFTESEFGRCSKRPGTNLNLCSSAGDVMRQPEKWCYRATIGRSYWKYILAADSPFVLDRLAAGKVCPFRYDFYQLMRNQLLAHCVQQDRWNGYDRVEFGILYPARNEALMTMRHAYAGESNTLAAWRGLLRNPASFQPLTIENFLGHSNLDAGHCLASWRSFIKEKYLI